MKHEKLSIALNEISDTHIAEAATPKRKVKLPWLGAVAAILVLVILVTAIGRPMTANAEGLIAAPTYPKAAKYDQPESYAVSTEDFFRQSVPALLGSGEENVACSPLNIYMALAMLAETTAGETREEILTLLGSDSLDALRTQADYVWNAHYRDDDTAVTLLATSLWLNNEFNFDQNTVNTLAESYYASVYRGDLDSDKMNGLLRDWLNEQTKDLLKEQAEEVEMGPNTLLALASTIYYKAPWSDDFNQVNNFEDVFYTPDGKVTATYMYKSFLDSAYYRGDNFGAVAVRLRDSSNMWLILPDEGYTTADVLAGEIYLDMLYDEDYENQTYPAINLSLPKFDIASDLDLISTLESMGIIQVFDSVTADFTAVLPDEENAYVSQISHAARVSIDEKGVTGAAYTVEVTDNAASDYNEPIDFILNRPFIFLVESRDGLPLFAGVVSSP